MHITDTEKDFWPWNWMHNGNLCQTVDDYKKAWLGIDWLHDPSFSVQSLKYRNGAGDKKSRRVSKHVECVLEDFDITNKISLADYQAYAIEKFNTQMEKIVNEHNVALGLSGGIDSTMCLSWLIKNKVDFETFTWTGDPWKGPINNMCENNAKSMAKLLGVKHTTVDFEKTKFDKHDLIYDYTMAENYSFPQMDLMSQGDNWNIVWQELFDDKIRLAPIGTDDLFLHKPNTWSRFIDDDTYDLLQNVVTEPAHLVTNMGYKMAGYTGKWLKHYKWEQGYQMMRGWDDVLLYFMLNGTMVSPATSKEWFETWHRIDENTCDDEQLRDIMGVGWLKRHVVKEIGDDKILPLIKSVPCTEIYYTPNAKNYEMLVSQCLKISKIYAGAGNVGQVRYWKGALQLLKVFRKLTPTIIESIHTINWLLLNQKKSIK